MTDFRKTINSYISRNPQTFVEIDSVSRVSIDYAEGFVEVSILLADGDTFHADYSLDCSYGVSSSRRHSGIDFEYEDRVLADFIVKNVPAEPESGSGSGSDWDVVLSEGLLNDTCLDDPVDAASFSGLSDATRISVSPCGYAASVSFAFNDSRTVTAYTDENRDGMYFLSSSFPLFPLRSDETLSSVFAARDFSLNRFDLSTYKGRAAAREYVRRKVKKLRPGATLLKVIQRSENARNSIH